MNPTRRPKAGGAWGGGAVELTVTCPKGFAGRLLVNFSTQPGRGNRRMPRAAGFALDGQRHFFMGPRGPGVWGAFDVTGALSAAGRVVLKMSMGGGAIGRIALVPTR